MAESLDKCGCEGGAVSSQGVVIRVYDPVTGLRHNVCGVTAFNGPQTTLPEVDATTLCSAAREFIPGLKDNGTLSLTVQTRMGSTGQRIIAQSMNERQKLRLEMVLPDDGLGNGEIIASFDGFVTGFPISGQIDGILSSEISIRITGDVVYDFPYAVAKTVSRLIQGETKSVTLTFSNNGEAAAGLSVMFPQNADFVELTGTSQTLITDSAGAVNLLLTVKTGGTKVITAVTGERVIEINFETTVPTRTMTSNAAPGLALGVPVPVNFTVTEVVTGNAAPTPAPAGVKVTLAANTAFSELAGGPVELTTDAAGKISLTLTPLASGSFTLTAAVYGAPVAVPAVVSVAVPVYAVTAAPTALTENAEETVVFSFTAGSAAVPGGMSVTFPINASFSELSAPKISATDASGQVTLELTPVVAGTVSLSAVLEGQTLSVDFTVTAA